MKDSVEKIFDDEPEPEQKSEQKHEKPQISEAE